MPSLVPELTVTDLDASLQFYRGLLGWTVAYDRPEHRLRCWRWARPGSCWTR